MFDVQTAILNEQNSKYSTSKEAEWPEMHRSLVKDKLSVLCVRLGKAEC